MKKPSTATGPDPLFALAPPRVRRLGLTGDCLRFTQGRRGFEWFPRLNVAWLEALLGLPERCAEWGIAYQRLSPPAGDQDWVDAVGDGELALALREQPLATWARQHDLDGPPPFAALHESLVACDLVVGFELSKRTRRHLQQHGRRYLSLRIHPLRFLPDLCFSVATNCPVLASAAAATSVPGGEIAGRVRWLRALFARAGHPAFALPEGTPLMVGQTAGDSVLLHRGGFIRWEHVEDQVLQALEGHDTVAWLPHPHQGTTGELVRLVTRRWGRHLITTDANAYGVLCSNARTPVLLALSSSLAIEAQALGLQARLLHGDPGLVDSLPEFEIPLQAPLGHGLLGAGFWSAVLGVGSADPDMPDGPFARGENHIRNTLEAWAFAPLRQGLSVGATHKRVHPAAPLDAARSRQLVLALAGCGDDPDANPRAVVEQAAQAGVTISVAPAPLAMGEVRTVQFNRDGAAHYLLHGFHEPEHWGVWSAQPRASIRIPLTAAKGPAPRLASLELQVRIFRGLLREAPVLTVSTGGHALAYLTFRPHGAHEQAVQLLAPADEDELVLDFHTSATVVASAAEQTADQRTLGFALIRMKIALQESAAAIARPPSLLCGVTDAPVPLSSASGASA